MKKTTFGFLIFYALASPSFSYAQVPFGGLDEEPFPECDCTPTTLDPETAYELACASPVTAAKPPTFFFDFFAPLWIAYGVPIGGFLAIPIAETLVFPTYKLVPGEWALGYLDMGIPAICGFAIPVACASPEGFYPSVACFPITELPVYGVVDPETGAAPGGFI